MAGDIFTLDADNNAAVRTVPVNAAASETNSPVIFTTDEDGNTAVRTVSVNAGASETNSPVIFTTDEDGNAAVRVVGAGGGSTPVIDELNVTPSTSAQTITAPSGTDGYSPVNVAAVTSAIDANITAGNIKKDVSILGVTGSYEGQIPTGTKSITANGVYDVTNYASADVQVPTTAPAHYLEFYNNNGTLEKRVKQIDFTGLTSLGNSLQSLFSGVDIYENTVFSLNPITNIDMNTSLNGTFANVTRTTNYNFHLDFSSVKIINGSQSLSQLVYNSSIQPTGTGVLSVDFSGLETINGIWVFSSAFRNTSLETLSFPKLSTIAQDFCPSASASMCAGCKKLSSVSFGSITSATFSNKKTQIQYMFDADTGSSAANGCTVHFPSNFDPSDPNHTFDASTLSGYPTFGGNASYIHIAFDLPATES